MDVLAERILLDLKNIFKKDPLIDEFDILPIEESLSNKCPVLHVDHKVAIEKWCVKHVYVYAYNKFFAWRKGGKSGEIVEPESLLIWTCAILLITPTLETAWNARKEMILQNNLKPCDELRFSELVLSHRPKSSPVYAHRQWVLQNSNTVISLEREFSLCSRWANLYPSNYYAWGHRLWVLKTLGHNKTEIIQQELLHTEGWVSTHISDHCGLHYRQQLISALPSTTPVLKRELDFCTELQKTYPGHEALWAHRRFLLWTSSNQHAHHSENKTCDLIHHALNSSECNLVPCHGSDKIQIRLNNVTYCHHYNEMKKTSFNDSDGNEHFRTEKTSLDSKRISDVLHSDILQRTSNVKREIESSGTNDPSETVEPPFCNGVLEHESGQNCDTEEVLKGEMEFVCERQGAARDLPWENLLLHRHVKWMSSILGNTQFLSK